MYFYGTVQQYKIENYLLYQNVILPNILYNFHFISVNYLF